MDIRTSHTPRTVLVLAALALTAGACGSSGGTTSSSARLAGASAPAGAVVSTAAVGGATALVSADGHTLYEPASESPGHILCTGSCTTIWQPVMASRQQAARATTALHRHFTVTTRPDGGTQLVYAGHPLYVFTPEGPHQMQGDGVADQFGSTHFQWSAVRTGGGSGAAPSAGTTPSGSGGGGGYGY